MIANAASGQSGASRPRVTFAILAYNRREEVAETLRKLTSGIDYPAELIEIIVADNASRDGTSEMVRGDFPAVKCLTLPANVGVGGWNHAFEVATGDYLFVLDDDSAPLSGVSQAIDYLEANARVGILACKVIGGAFGTEGFALRDRQEWVGFIGCGAIIRRALFERIGGFAEWLFIYAHEWEYGLRCLDAGYEIRFFEACVVEHRAAATNRSWHRLITYTFRNELLMVYKHFPRKRVIHYCRVVVLLAVHFMRLRTGLRSIPYAVEGVWRSILDARHLSRSYVKPEVQDRFTAQLLSTQPILPKLVRQTGRMLGLLPTETQATRERSVV